MSAHGAEGDQPRIGDRVRIAEDEYPEMVGRTGVVRGFTQDGTIAWVSGDRDGDHPGAWCATGLLSVLPPEES